MTKNVLHSFKYQITTDELLLIKLNFIYQKIPSKNIRIIPIEYKMIEEEGCSFLIEKHEQNKVLQSQVQNNGHVGYMAPYTARILK